LASASAGGLPSIVAASRRSTPRAIGRQGSKSDNQPVARSSGGMDLAFMPDCYVDPLWDAAGALMVSLKRLPVAEVMRRATRVWASRMARLLGQLRRWRTARREGSRRTGARLPRHWLTPQPSGLSPSGWRQVLNPLARRSEQLTVSFVTIQSCRSGPAAR
jgi:hypothetical protein